MTPFLWFEKDAEEAAKHYVSIFKNSKISNVARMGNSPNGPVLTVEFELDGQRVIALNGGPHFKLTEAFSFSISCQTQEEIDHYWSQLVEGGQPSRCGWLKDKFGLSWQVVPQSLSELLQDKDPKKAQRAMDAMLKMGKLDIEALKKAHEN